MTYFARGARAPDGALTRAGAGASLSAAIQTTETDQDRGSRPGLAVTVRISCATRSGRPFEERASSAKISGMAGFVWVSIALLVLTVGLLAIGRGLQRQGREMERRRD